jgi:auxin-responsive protein IAA
MGDSGGRREQPPLPRLLDLIPDGKERKGREAQDAGRSKNSGGFGGEEDAKLELKLGPPGLTLVEEGTTATVPRDGGVLQRETTTTPTLSLGCFPRNPSKPAVDAATAGTKRGFFDTAVEAKTEGTCRLVAA